MRKFALDMMARQVTNHDTFDAALKTAQRIVDALEVTTPAWIDAKAGVVELCDQIETHLKSLTKKPNNLGLDMFLDRLHDIRDTIVDENF